MNILFDHQAFSLQRHGGVSRYFTELISQLSSLKQDVTVYSPIYINEHLSHLDSPLSDGIFLKKDYRGIKRSIYKANDLLKYLLLRGKYDIVHETYYTENQSINSKCNVVTVFDMVEERVYGNNNSYSCKIKNLSLERADHVICISKQTQSDLIELYNIDKNKTSVIYLGHELNCNGSYNIPKLSGKPYILYVGKRSGYKNFSRVVSAYSKLKFLNSDIDIICFGGGKISQDECNYYISLGVGGNIKHMDGDDCTLSELYKNAIMFIYPSLYEGFGIPPLEAMSCQCPVICSNRSSIPEVVGDAGLYFNPHSDEEIMNTMKTVIMNSELRQGLIKKGLERVRRFTWKKTAHETLEVYRSLI